MGLDDQFSKVFEGFKQKLEQQQQKLPKYLTEAENFRKTVGQLLGTRGGIYETNTDFDNLDYGGWFNYFWKEGASLEGGLSDVEKGKIATVVFPLYLDKKTNRLSLRQDGKPLPNPPALQPRKEFVKCVEGHTDESPKEILKLMFDCGFKEADAVPEPQMDLFPNFDVAANMVEKGRPTHTGRLAFRGEGRSPYRVITHQGARCRASLTNWVDKANVKAWWNPWSDPEVLKKSYFRNGSKDNDFVTTTSLAYDFSIATAYPMVHLDIAGPVCSWTEDQKSKATRKGYYLVQCRNTKTQKEEKLLAMVSYVYVIDVTGLTVFRTWELNNYRESGTRDVTMANMIAFVRVLRILMPPENGQVFHSNQMEPAFTVHPLAFQLWPDEATVRGRFGCTETGVRQLKQDLIKASRITEPFDVDHNGKESKATYQRPKGSGTGEKFALEIAYGGSLKSAMLADAA